MGLFDKIQTIPFWKKIYQTISGYSQSVSSDIVQEVITMSNADLKEGYSVYERYSEEEYQKWENSFTEKDVDLLCFLKRLCKCLNLAPNVALPVFFNYLMFEYYGKLEDIQDLIIYDHSVMILLKDVWHFYTSERMFYIKTVRQIFECAVKPCHPFVNEYMNYIKSLDMIDFRKTFISQFNKLINEITDESLGNSFDRASYVNRNNREQLEFLLLIVMTMEYKPISISEFSTMFESFLQHNFTRQPIYFDTTLFGDPKDFIMIKYAEIGFFIIAMHQIGERIHLLPKSIEESLRQIQNQGDHKIVLFSWVLSKIKEFKENEMEPINTYENLVKVLIDEQTFTSIAEFLSSDLMQANIRSAKLIQAGVFKLLNEFVIALESKQVLFDNDGLHWSIVNLIQDLDIACECSSSNGGLDVIVKMTFERFPKTFLKLTNISKVLVQHEPLVNAVLTKLSNLRVFDLVLVQPKQRHISYFSYLAKMIKQLFATNGKFEDFDHILAGYELIYEVVSYYKGDLKSCGITECIVLLEQFVNSYRISHNNIPLVGVYFKIYTSLVMNQSSSLQNEFHHLKIARQFLPKVHIDKHIPEILMQCTISDSTLTNILKNEEHEPVHNILKTYLRFLEYCISQNLDPENIQTPGVIYMVRFVFTQHKNWQFTDPSEQTEISLLSMKIMLEVLIKSSSQSNEILKQFLFYALLKKPPMMNIFLQYFIQEKFHLQRVMLNEIDWHNGKMLKIVTLSKLHLSIFLRLMSECNLKSSDALLSSKIQTVAKCAVSFITNAFSSSLANLACRLLEILSRDSNIPILAVLEMDCSQIQCLFLEKLRDPLEDDIFKITILDFINTSLLSQNGLTAAFFNALDALDKKAKAKNVSNDSVCDFMIDYLQNIQKNPEYVTNPVQRSILRVFSTLWSTGRENLVQDIYSLHCFWPLLTEPLFHPKMKDPEVYTHIMIMTTIHITEFRKNTHENLKGVIVDFFKNDQLINEWTSYIESVLCISADDDQYKEITKFITAWKKFLVSIKTYYPDAISSRKVRYSLILSCLKGILCHSSRQFDNQIITDFSDLYLILIFTWSDSYKSEIETIELLSSVLKAFVKCRLPSFHNREVFLTLIHKTIEDCSELLRSNPYLLNNLLKPFGYIFDLEYENLCANHEDIDQKINSAVSWTLVSRIGDSVLSLSGIQQFSLFFKYHQYLQKMLDSIRILLSNACTVPMVKMILQNLILYAKSAIAMDFLTDNYSTIYDIIDNGANISPKLINGEFLIDLKEQWILYSMVIKLNHILLNRFGEKMLESNLIFVSVYDKIIPQMICLPEFTVDNRAFDLSYETLQYLHKLFDWLEVWSIKNNECFNVITLAIKRVLNSCITTILRTEHIQFYKMNRLGKLSVVYEKPNYLIPHVVNRYLELSCLALKCLIKCNPSMTDVLSIERPKSPCYLLVEYDFTIPKFDIPITEHLTYGRLLCFIYFLCKTLNHELNIIQSSTESSVTHSKGAIHFENKEKKLGDIFGKLTLLDDELMGFVEYPKRIDNVLQPTKLNAFLHYAEQGNSEPWLKLVCEEKVQITLEYLMTFVAVQAFFQVHTLHKPQLHYFKRELYSELQFFNEFSKKLAIDEFAKLSLKRTSDPQNIDVINRVAIATLSTKNVNQVSDRFYLLAISKWFQNICQLS